MAIDINFQHHEDILLAVARGKLTSKSNQALDREVAQTCLSQGYKKVIMDIREVEGLPNTFELYYSGENLGQAGFSHDMMIAMLDAEAYQDANQFFETVANNRGYNLKHFYSLDDAFTWLKSEQLAFD